MNYFTKSVPMSLYGSVADRARSTWDRNASLFKNSGALAISAVLTSGLGFVYWWYAARTFLPAIIGEASALIALMNLVGIIGEAGLGTLLVGEIVRWPGRKDGLITAAMLTSLALALIVGLLSLPFSRFLQADLTDDIILLIGCGFTGLCMISDQVFTGMLQSGFRLLRQFFFSIIRLISLVLVSLWASDQTIILFTWVISLGLSFVLGEVMMRRYGQSLLHRPDFDLLWRLKRRALDHYLLDLGVMVPPIIMPYLVTVMVSATSNAAFTVVWMIVGMAATVPGALAHVLFPVLRREPEQYREKMRMSLTISVIFAGVFALFLYFAEGLILQIFNPQYVEIAGGSLGLLGFGLIGTVLKYHVGTAARLGNKMRQASVWVCLGSLTELVGVCMGAYFGGLVGIGIAWPVVTILEGLVMIFFANPCHPTAIPAKETFV